MFDDLYIESELTEALDESLKNAKEGKIKCPCVPIHGLPGFGKTSITKSWLKHYNLKHVYIDAGCLYVQEVETEYLPADNLGQEPQVRLVSGEDLNDLFTPVKTNVKVILSSDIIDRIDSDTIVVFDNYGFTSKEVREELLKFIRNFIVIDPRVSNAKKQRRIVPLMMVVIATDEFKDEDKYNDFEKQMFGFKG